MLFTLKELTHYKQGIDDDFTSHLVSSTVGGEGFMSAFKCQNVLQAGWSPDDNAVQEAATFNLIIPLKTGSMASV